MAGLKRAKKFAQGKRTTTVCVRHTEDKDMSTNSKRGYRQEDAENETGSDKHWTGKAWHDARDNSGRGETNYGRDDFRNESMHQRLSDDISASLRDAGITDIQQLPSGYQSDEDK